METAMNEPHQHRCAAGIHAPGREVPWDPKESSWAMEDPQACGCPQPLKPQCCANHPMANPNYKPPRELGINQIQSFAIEIRELKADNADLKEQVAVLTAKVEKLEGLRVV